MKFKNSTNVIARDISWLSFNERVLQEACDENNPIVERLRFIGIFSSNMDEFFRVRYASIKRLSQISNSPKRRLGGLTPRELLAEISQIAGNLQSRAEGISDELLNKLEKEGVSFVDETELTTGQQSFVRNYFIEKVSPSVFTLILDENFQLPEIKDKSIYLAIKLVRDNQGEKPQYALIEIPSDLVGRFVELPKYGNRYVMYLEDLIRYNLAYIFFVFQFEKI